MIRLPDLPASNPQQPSPSMAAMQAPARALQDVSQGLATVGNALTSEAFRIQGIENARLESETRLSWNARLSELNQDLTRETDPAAIPRRTQELLAELQGTIDNEALPPVVRQRLGLQFDEFSTRTTISAGERASSLAITRAQKSFQNELDAAIRNHDRPALNAALDTASEAFGLLPEDRDRITQNFDHQLSHDLLDLDIAADPQGFLQLTTEQIREGYPELSPQEIRKAQTRAKQLHQHIRSEEFDRIIGAIDEGDATLETIEQATSLTNQDKTRLKRALAREAGEAVAPEEHAKAWDILFKLRDTYKDPAISDADYAAQWNDARAEALSLLPSNMQGDLRQELSYRSPANRRGGQAANLPSNAANKSEARFLIRHAATEGLLTGSEDPMQTAQAQAKLNIALDQFLQKNPGASWEDTVLPWLQKQIGFTSAQLDSLIPVPGITAPPNPISRAALEAAIQNGDIPGVLPSDEENANATRIPPFNDE